LKSGFIADLRLVQPKPLRVPLVMGGEQAASRRTKTSPRMSLFEVIS
jgi:hypothetical protein